jgi:Zn-dependent hydrolases, including glyoxylases
VVRNKILFQLVGLYLLSILIAGCAGNQSSPTPTLQTSTNSPASITRINITEELYIRQIREDVFEVIHSFPWPANSLIVEMANSDLVLVGTPYTPDAMNDVLSWILARWGKRKIIEINTGYHVDNLGGNSALIEQGIPVYGSDLTIQLLKERGEETRKEILDMLKGEPTKRYYRAHTEIPYIAPNQLFSITKGLRLQFGNDEVIVYYPGPSHAPDNVVVYFPSMKVLFGGCMILGGDQIGNTLDADLNNWPEAIRKLKQFEVEIVVPGHGDRIDPGLIDHTIALLTVVSG